MGKIVNTILPTYSNKKLWSLKGFNTDAYGFHQLIKPFLKSHHNLGLILGDGGASKAVSYVFDLLNILNPLIKSESVWKSHALYLMAEFFYSKNEMQKSKEFFNQIINLENANQEIQLEARKRLNRDLSE